jgi:hypothetical protein
MKKPNHWQSIYGSFLFETSRIIFQGGRVPQPGQISTPAAGLAMSDATYSGGGISALIKYKDAERAPSVQLVLFRNPIDNSMVAAGIEGDLFNDTLNTRFVVNILDTSEGYRTGSIEFHPVASTYWVESPRTREIALRVRSAGSLIDLYADGVQVLRCILRFSPPPSQCGLYVRSPVNVEVEDFSVDAKRRTAFVIMRFAPPFEHLFKDVIKPIANDCDIDAEKADDILGPGMIISDIIRRLQEADIVIADVTAENANVYYELGYAHALAKPTILLAEKGKALPFDISGFRTLFYENSIAGKGQIETGLKKHLEAVVADRPL